MLHNTFLDTTGEAERLPAFVPDATAGASFERPIRLPTVAEAVATAMRGELDTTPKPGLVDRVDAGAHRDMTYDTFARSIKAIAPLFAGVPPVAVGQPLGPMLFAQTRRIGVLAERAMFTATGGVNTHKGQIFVLMLLSTAVSALRWGANASRGWTDTPPPLRTVDIREAVRKMTVGIVKRELETVRHRGGNGSAEARHEDNRADETHGERLFRVFGITGVRGEAEAGFPAIFETALPVYRALRNDGFSWNDAAVQALLFLMTRVDDTTVLHRGGYSALGTMRSGARAALERGGVLTAGGRRRIAALNAAFIANHISPGGCADLLAGTLFVDHVTADRTTADYDIADGPFPWSERAR